MSQPVPAMVVVEHRKEFRTVMGRRNAASLSIVHSHPVGSASCCWGMLPCCDCNVCDMLQCKCPCLCAQDPKVRDSEYTWVMDNRVEYNRPFETGCMCCTDVMDNVSVVYYDQFDVVKNKTPCCAGCRGVNGVAALQQRCPCPCCCCTTELNAIGRLEDAAVVVARVNEMKEIHKNYFGDF
eukprot:35847_1